MTSPKITVAHATAALARITMELDGARQDLALLERLQSAADRVKRLTAEQAKATKDRDAAVAAEQKARDETRFKGLSDIRVVDTTPEEGVLRSGFTITYTRVAYDMDTGKNLPQPVTISSFGGLPDNAFAFLIERHADRIPAKIMALAPDDPKAAFERYFRALTRGYVAA